MRTPGDCRAGRPVSQRALRTDQHHRRHMRSTVSEIGVFLFYNPYILGLLVIVVMVGLLYLYDRLIGGEA